MAAKKKKKAPAPYHPYPVFRVNQVVVVSGRSGTVTAVIGTGPNASVYVKFRGWHSVTYRAYQLV